MFYITQVNIESYSLIKFYFYPVNLELPFLKVGLKLKESLSMPLVGIR